jgi:hypothetical protein
VNTKRAKVRTNDAVKTFSHSTARHCDAYPGDDESQHHAKQNPDPGPQTRFVQYLRDTMPAVPDSSDTIETYRDPFNELFERLQDLSPDFLTQPALFSYASRLVNALREVLVVLGLQKDNPGRSTVYARYALLLHGEDQDDKSIPSELRTMLDDFIKNKGSSTCNGVINPVMMPQTHPSNLNSAATPKMSAEQQKGIIATGLAKRWAIDDRRYMGDSTSESKITLEMNGPLQKMNFLFLERWKFHFCTAVSAEQRPPSFGNTSTTK